MKYRVVEHESNPGNWLVQRKAHVFSPWQFYFGYFANESDAHIFCRILFNGEVVTDKKWRLRK